MIRIDKRQRHSRMIDCRKQMRSNDGRVVTQRIVHRYLGRIHHNRHFRLIHVLPFTHGTVESSRVHRIRSIHQFHAFVAVIHNLYRITASLTTITTSANHNGMRIFSFSPRVNVASSGSLDTHFQHKRNTELKHTRVAHQQLVGLHQQQSVGALVNCTRCVDVPDMRHIRIEIGEKLRIIHGVKATNHGWCRLACRLQFVLYLIVVIIRAKKHIRVGPHSIVEHIVRTQRHGCTTADIGAYRCTTTHRCAMLHAEQY
mmetsp:Transcript_32022/g.51776  ORF Transcript_32022/g.51776 Transcript_32022/m.51776 type:complete len:257 (-) Transcript_32022:1472-2242(-)